MDEKKQDTKTLEEIIERLQEQQANSDIEIAHGEADDLLIEALMRIAYNHNWLKADIFKIIEAWEKVPKWYA
jgi:hypothetical protein